MSRKDSVYDVATNARSKAELELLCGTARWNNAGNGELIASGLKGDTVREALARADHDFVLAQPSRRRGVQEVRPNRFAFLLRRPGRLIVLVTSAGVLTGIVLNAVMFQTGQHPAPLFAAHRAQPQAQQVAPRVPAPPARTEMPALQPAPAPAPVVAAAPAPAPVVTPQAAPAAQAPAATAPARKDPIAMLLNGEAPVENSARILAVQKALIKAGYVLKADGVMRPSTRQALEGFERERKLPVTGEFNPRTLRELSQRTGIAIP
jgi:hypothetical protein